MEEPQVFSVQNFSEKEIKFSDIKQKTQTKRTKRKKFNIISLYSSNNKYPVYIQTNKLFCYGIQKYSEEDENNGYYCNISLSDEKNVEGKQLINLINNVRKTCIDYIYKNRIICGFKEETLKEYIENIFKDNIYTAKEGVPILGLKLIGNIKKIYSKFYDCKIPLNEGNEKLGEIDPLKYFDKYFYMITLLGIDSLYITTTEIRLNINLTEAVVYEVTKREYKRLIRVFPVENDDIKDDGKDEE